MFLSLRPNPSPISFPQPTLIPKPRTLQTSHFPCFSTSKPNRKSINNNSTNGPDSRAAPDLAEEVSQRIKTQMEERERAMRNSKEVLFTEVCKFLCFETGEQGKNKWRKMSEDEKMGLVKGFVSDWGSRFHPLSASSVRDLVDEFVTEQGLDHDDDVDDDNDTSFIFPRLKKLMLGLYPKK